MKVSNVNIGLENVTNGGKMILTDVRPAHAYKDGVRQDKVIGIKATVAMEKNGYDTLTVTVSDPVDRLSTVLEQSDGPVYVTFDGFSARIYVMDGRAGVSAKATAVRVVPDNIMDLDVS